MLAIQKIPSSFRPAFNTIQNLKNKKNILGAFIIGSAARGELNIDSDLDVVVLVGQNNHTCTDVSHPIIEGVKLDISFLTIEEVTKNYESELKTREIKPTIADSIIVFDKSGKLVELKNRSKKIKPLKLKISDFPAIQYLAYHMIQNACRLLEIDPNSSLLVMNSEVNDLLKVHYKINRKWWKSNKRLLNDLRAWDPKLGNLLERFLTETKAKNKFKLLKSLAFYILNPIGGFKDVSDMKYYHCYSCKKYLDCIL